MTASPNAREGLLQLGPTFSELFAVFATPVLGLVMGSVLLAASLPAAPLGLGGWVGIIILVASLVLLVLEIRDLPRRTLSWDSFGFRLHLRGRRPLQVRWSEVGTLALRTESGRLWRIVPRQRVLIECQTMSSATHLEQRYPAVHDYEPAGDDAPAGGVRMLLGYGMGRARLVDQQLRHASGLYIGIQPIESADSGHKPFHHGQSRDHRTGNRRGR